ncbi:MAG: hypothetical protein SFW65_00215 [Alphaproteobacteria bacterium]|nr:hypothetical protein [Alphaproteobacteria bacterium]
MGIASAWKDLRAGVADGREFSETPGYPTMIVPRDIQNAQGLRLAWKLFGAVAFNRVKTVWSTPRPPEYQGSSLAYKAGYFLGGGG